MRITVEEMKGLLSGRAMPSDMFVSEDLASYLVRKFSAIRGQLTKVALESMQLRDAIEAHSESTHFCNTCGQDDECATDDVCLALNIPTPVTDRFANAMRAEGVEIYADELQRRFDAVNYSEIKEYTTNGDEDKVSDYGEVQAARQFAKQLRGES